MSSRPFEDGSEVPEARRLLGDQCVGLGSFVGGLLGGFLADAVGVNAINRMAAVTA